MANKLLIHIGTGESRKTYTFDYDRLMNVESIAIERQTGLSLNELLNDALPRVSMIAVTAVVWILRRRNEPGLQFEDVQFAQGDLEVESVDDEPVEDAAPKEAGPDEEVPAPS